MALRCLFAITCLVATSAAFGGQPDAADTTAAGAVYDIRHYGAIRDYGAGATSELATAAIQRAIDAAASHGGGTAYLPPGIWRSGTIFLKSHVTLYLEAGAVLAGSTNAADYPKIRPKVRSYTDYYVEQSLIAGENLTNIAIRGRGTIDGHGEAFRWKEYLTRPYVIRLVNCEDVLVEGVFLRNSPMWMQEYLACRRLVVRGIRVSNHVTYNNDGLDIDGCRDVVVSDCLIDSDDDAICLKSTLDAVCENVTITNCVLSSPCNAIKTGTESNGGFRNISVSSCVIKAPPAPVGSVYHDRKLGQSGISLLIVDGGHMDRVTISNVAMTGVSTPIFIRLGDRARPFAEGGRKPGKGTMQNILISQVVATGADRRGCAIVGLPGQQIKNVALSDIRLSFSGGGTARQARAEVPEKPADYPSAGMFGEQPAYGFYCRHVRGLSLDRIDLETVEPDARPALLCDDVKELAIDRLSAMGPNGSEPVLRLVNSSGALLSGCRLKTAAAVFLGLEGAGSTNVALFASDLSRAAQVATFANGAAEPALHVSSCLHGQSERQ